MDVVEQRVAGALDVVGDGRPGDGDVLRPEDAGRWPGRAASRPEHVVFGGFTRSSQGRSARSRAPAPVWKMRVGPDRIEGMVRPKAVMASVPTSSSKIRYCARLGCRLHSASAATRAASGRPEGGEEGHGVPRLCGVAKLGNLGVGKG